MRLLDLLQDRYDVPRLERICDPQNTFVGGPNAKQREAGARLHFTLLESSGVVLWVSNARCAF